MPVRVTAVITVRELHVIILGAAKTFPKVIYMYVLKSQQTQQNVIIHLTATLLR